MSQNASVAQYGGHTTPPPPPNLAHTGLDVGLVVSAGLLLVVTGVALWRRVSRVY